MLEFALRYAALGWFIFPLHLIVAGRCGCGKPDCRSPGKHPRIKWKAGASHEEHVVRDYWGKWPSAGIGLATGPSGLLVADADGPKGVETFRGLLAGQSSSVSPTAVPPTARARTARGVHVFFRGAGRTRSDPETKLDTRGVGGFVVLAPSPHVSGHVYRWEVEPEAGIAEAPDALVAYSQGGKKRGALGEGMMGGTSTAPWEVPSREIGTGADFTTRLGGCLADWHEVDRALAKISPDVCMDEWIRVGMALHAAGDDGHRWDQWSSRGQKYHEGEPAYKWTTFKQVPDGIGLGSLFVIAKEYGYKKEVMPAAPGGTRTTSISETRPPQDQDAAGVEMNGHQFNGEEQGEFFRQFNSEIPSDPLIRLNKDYAVIGNVGGKCLVLSWENSPIDERVKIPAFQSFKSFSERFGNEYIPMKKVKHLKGGAEEYEDRAQLGAYWLRWPERRTYSRVELRPNEPEVLPNGSYNLWQGWGVTPAPGRWERMRDHIGEILAQGRSDHADYILRWGAWAVQNPGLLAEAALVTRGDQGAGKGVFGRALRKIFGSHGLQIFNYKHLVGNFNEHMRTCLFLFADEAHWAGDRQGAATLKGLITEPTRMLEGKGVNAVMWPNQVKLLIAANASWAIPAAHDERRYAVFDILEKYKQMESYFRPLYAELATGGLEAMLFDLLQMDLGDWTPRRVPQTKALQHQKDLTMEPLMEWWHGMLSGEGELRFKVGVRSGWASKALNDGIREEIPRHAFSAKRLAEFMYNMGATNQHTMTGARWNFPTLEEGRAIFEKKFGSRDWTISVDKWEKG